MRPLQVLSLAAALALPTGAQEVLTLSRALERAGQASLSADVARMAVAAAKEDSAQVKAMFLPELSLTGGHLNLSDDPALKAGPFTLGPIQAGPLTIPALHLGPLEMNVAEQVSWRYKVSAQYLVYDFGRRAKALEATRTREDAVAQGGTEAVRRTQAEVAGKYVTLMAAKARKQVVAQRRQALEGHLGTVKALFDQGVVARNDVLRTEVALRSVEDADRALDAAIASAMETLNVALGLEPAAPQTLPAALGEPPAVPWDEAAVRTRSEANAGVKALGLKARALEAQVEGRRRDVWAPSVVAELAHTYEQNRWAVHNHTDSLYVGLAWKLFDGGTRRAKVRQAGVELEQARRELLEGRRQAESAAVATHRQYRVALQELETARANEAAALENLRIVSDQYKEGLAKSTDVLDAESVLAESRFGLVEKRARAYGQQAALLAVLGEDLPGFYRELDPKTGEK